ncbi:MAG: FAD-dependent oxidoreductase [Actinomycetota bacterium]|nr:FAD-dependent oxidoreductase [Actinomycetota bacterium]
MTDQHPRLAILGAGPTGLDAALAAADLGWPFTVYEAADRPAGHVREWGHVRLFTPWSLNVSPRMARHLEAAGLTVPGDDACPTGDELCDRVLDPVAALPEVAPAMRLDSRVLSIGRHGLLKHEEIATAERGAQSFRLLVSGADGEEEVVYADVVLDCTGTYSHPNTTGDGGIPAVGEGRLDAKIRRTLPDVGAEEAEWAGRTVLVVGSGHSAQTAAADLAALARRQPATKVVWAVRATEPTWGAVADDPLPERAALVERSRALAGGDEAVSLETGVVVEALTERDGRVAVTLRNGTTSEVVVDTVLSLTGAVGDNSIYRQLQVHECYATAAPINLSAALLGAAGGDCLQQESHGVDVLRNPEPNFFILGAKSYGRVNQFLMRVGWEQVDEVVAALAVPADA